MVEENRHSDQPPPSSAWLVRWLAIGLSVTAVFRALAGGLASSTAPTAERTHPDGRDGPPPGGLQHPTVHYERSDINFRWIFGILIGAAVLAAIIHYAVLRFFYGYQDYEAAMKSSHYPLAPVSSGSLPPEPRLEQINRMAGI